MTTELKSKILQALGRWNQGICPGGQILIEKDGQILLEESLGYANLENQVPITSESIFHIASVSKQFTVMAALLLQQDGKINLDDPAPNYVGDLLEKLQPYQAQHGSISLRQLCNNTSGLRDIWELLQLSGYRMTDEITEEDLDRLICHQTTLNFPPGERYLYSNTGFYLLAKIVERLSGLDFPYFVQERIFRPLGMEHTRIRRDCYEIISNLALSYLDEGQSYFYYPLNYALSGPTSVNTCASDLIKVISEYANPRLLTPDHVNFMLSPAITNRGMKIEYCGGLMEHRLQGYNVIEHSGADAAYRANFFWLPEKNLKIILLSNTNTYYMQHKTHEIANILLEAEGQAISALRAQEADNMTTSPAKEASVTKDFDSQSSCIAEEDSMPCSSHVYVSDQDGVPHVLEIMRHGQHQCIRRELALAPLCWEDMSQSYRVGHLDERVQFTQEGLIYTTPTTNLTYLKGEPLASGSLPYGDYCLVEQPDVTFTLECYEGYLYIRTPRNGTTPLYQLGDQQAVFSFGPEFTFSLQLKENQLELNGDRVRHLMATRIE